MMATSKKPRKAYKPPACRATAQLKGCLAIDRTIAKSQPYTPERKAEIAITHRMELQRVITGKGTTEDLDQLAIVYGVTAVIGETIGQECSEVCMDAAEAILDARRRYRNTGRIGLNGQGLQNITALLDLYEEMLEHITPLQYEKAVYEVMARLKKGNVLKELE